MTLHHLAQLAACQPGAGRYRRQAEQVAEDGEERGEDQPGVEDDEAAGLGHVLTLRGAWSWSRGTEMSIRGRSNEVTADQGTIRESAAAC